MAEVTLLAQSVNSDSSYTANSNYPASNCLNRAASNPSGYAGFACKTGSNAETYVYLDFDCSEIPSNATNINITANINYYGTTTVTNRTSTRYFVMCSGTTQKGTSTTFTTTATYTIDDGGSWTRSELNDCRLLMYLKRNTTNSSSTTTPYLRGVDITITYEEASSGGDSTDTGGEIIGDSASYSYTGSVQTVTLTAGKYKLQCWGAQGGNYSTYYGGKGGYSSGILTLTSDTTVYIYVGGQPTTNSTSRAVTSGGFNGGGNGQNRYYSSVYTYGQGGGGASDIRIGQDSLYARVIVAGGGGGSASDNTEAKYGGGETGGPGGASESSSYIAGQTAPTTSGYYLAGTFGQGAAAYTSRTNYQHGSGGGGGGWYGGYAYNYSQDSQSALRTYNGGGSGYVYTESTASNYPSGCLLNSSYYLTEAITVGGNSSFPSYSSGTTTGNEGNGYVIITKITEEETEERHPLRVKISSQWKIVNKVYQKTDGTWIEVSDLSTIFPSGSNQKIPYKRDS